MSKYDAWLPAVALAWMVMGPAASVHAQLPRGEQTPNDTLISPEVMSDHRVVFRIYAPKASEVTMRGDWMPGREGVKLEKDAQGVWSAIAGPLTPDFYKLYLHRRWREDHRPEERHDQAGGARY